MSRLFKIAGYVAGVLAAFMLFRFTAALGAAGLMLVFSFAFVGPGNRLAWIAVFPVVAAILAAVGYGIFAILPEDNERLKLLVAFAGMPVVPGLVLWAAVRFRKYRAERLQQPPTAQDTSSANGVV
ncbi:hypothetical protein [Roseateles sp. BYS96W]|uniref:Uncharacterized protein n=1 Tax=Pelomonas nitida TaxID=3299027 RepID=A0ABW7GB93_9BURK